MDVRRSVFWCLLLLMFFAGSARAEDAVDYFNLGMKSTATRTKIKYYSKALELAPNLVDAYENRGMLYFFQNKFDNAVQDFQAYASLAPPKADIYRMLGVCHLKMGNDSSAIDHLTHAIDMNPQLAAAYAARAEAYLHRDHYDLTISDTTEAVRLGGDPRIIAEAYRTRAKAYRKIGENDLSAADIRSSWQIDPRYAYYYRALYGYANPEGMRKTGLIVIIGIAFIIIFKVKFKPPEKDR